ncbi:MAG: tetratricopeptide repeat protein, partial [Candidatus Lokiarchaeota archaeon]|nr:tetratricopeptide repeat protein [Candidatus Lokiarchaeota archaeon]
KDQLDEAMRYYKEALAIDEQLGDLQGKARDLNNIGLLLFKQEKYAQALSNFENCVEILSSLGIYPKYLKKTMDWIESTRDKLQNH